MEDGGVGGVGGVVAVDLAGDDDADGRGLGDHGADLDGRGVGAHEEAVAAGASSAESAIWRVSWVSRAGWLGGKLRASKL